MSRRHSTGILHHPVRKKFQAKHIPDQVMLRAISDTSPPYPGMTWRMRWNVESTLSNLVEVPDGHQLGKVMMAKITRLLRRGAIDGCDCGCRGDFEVLEH